MQIVRTRQLGPAGAEALPAMRKPMSKLELSEAEEQEMRAKLQQALMQLHELIDTCIRQVVDEVKSRPADSVNSLVEFRARVLQRLVAQEPTILPLAECWTSLRTREGFLGSAVEMNTEYFADIWKCPDCGAPLESKSTVQ